MGLLTTTIGAFPKPDYLDIPDWFSGPRGTQTEDPTGQWAAAMEKLGANATQLIERATREVVEDQTRAGIDIPTDGEVPRENYIHYHCRHLDGVDFQQLTETAARAGDFRTNVPTVISPVALREDYAVNDWRRAQSFTERPVKMTLPGPMTTADTLGDDYYRDGKARGAAFADALNQSIRSLADAGCRHIQLDEPVFVRYVPQVLEFGIENVERAFHGCPPEVTRTLHICCSYPESLDPDYNYKAPKEAYGEVATALDGSSLMAISIEDAHRHNDASLFEQFQNTILILGCFDIGSSQVERVEDIRTRMLEVMNHIDADRLIAAPDCGLGLLGRDLAMKKLSNLVEAAKSV